MKIQCQIRTKTYIRTWIASLLLSLFSPLAIALEEPPQEQEANLKQSQEAIKGTVPEPLQDGHQKNVYYPAACSIKELKKLKQEILKLAAASAPDNAWQVASTMMCGEGVEAKKFILGHMAKQIKYFGPEDQDLKYIDGTASVLLEKKAWGVSAQKAEFGIGVMYQSAGICSAFSFCALTTVDGF